MNRQQIGYIVRRVNQIAQLHREDIKAMYKVIMPDIPVQNVVLAISQGTIKARAGAKLKFNGGAYYGSLDSLFDTTDFFAVNDKYKVERSAALAKLDAEATRLKDQLVFSQDEAAACALLSDFRLKSFVD